MRHYEKLMLRTPPEDVEDEEHVILSQTVLYTITHTHTHTLNTCAGQVGTLNEDILFPDQTSYERTFDTCLYAKTHLHCGCHLVMIDIFGILKHLNNVCVTSG